MRDRIRGEHKDRSNTEGIGMQREEKMLKSPGGGGGVKRYRGYGVRRRDKIKKEIETQSVLGHRNYGKTEDAEMHGVQ